MTPSESDNPTEPSSAADVPDDNPYYVLRRGEILGPFREDQLPELVTGGLVEYDDFVQQAGSSEWLPLRWLLIPNDAQDLEGALAPTWRTLLKWSWLRLRYNLDEQSLSAGWVCLGLALAGLFLSRWPMLLWAPWAVLAFFGGIALYRRQQPGPGIALMLAAAIVPGGLWAYFWTTAPTATINAAPAPVAVISAPAPIQKPTAEAQPATASAPVPPPPPPITAIPGLVPAADLEKLAPPTPATVTPQPAPAPATESAPVPPAPTAPSPTQAAASASKIIADYATQIGAKITDATGPGTPAPDISALGGALVTSNSSNLVFVSDETNGSAGSGFICEFRGKPALITNMHVVAGMRSPRFTKLDKSGVQTYGTPSGAVGHDILYYPLPPATPLPSLRAAPHVEDIATIGDDVFVLGNSEGARVITPLAGKIVGLGPDLVEVSSEFVPGNSGSPIIHAKSGMVIGIATYLSVRDRAWLSEESGQPKIRRFGYRLDSVKTWQPIEWNAFSKEQQELEKVRTLTGDLAKLLRDMRDGVIIPSLHTNPAIATHVRTFIDKVGGTVRINAADRLAAETILLSFMRNVSQKDITDVGPRIHYDYLLRALNDEKVVRTQFTEIFDKLVKSVK
jgi:hypothetical protein